MAEKCPYCNNPDLYQIPHSGGPTPLACGACGWEGVRQDLSQWGESNV